MAGTTFEAECENCGGVHTFEEFSRERRLVKSDQAMARGDFKFEWEYKFRCANCGQRYEKLLDTSGNLHKWQGARHVSMHVGADDE